MRTPILPPRKASRATKRKRQNLTLGEYTDRYFSSRDCTEGYKQDSRARIECFIQWYGCDPRIKVLTCDVANEWLSALMGTGLAPVTVDNYRRALRVVWMFAYMEGDAPDPPFRLKKIRVRRQASVEAYTHDEIGKLLTAAKALVGYFPNGVKRCMFWKTAISAAYSTGLRRHDLLVLNRSEIAADGMALVVMHKTGYRVAVRFSDEAMEGIRTMAGIVENDERAIPWPHHENALPRQFRALTRRAGVTRGSWKWLRRSCGSYAEAANPGTGYRALGHRSLQVFNGHYNDEKITVAKPVSPPPLLPDQAEGGVA